MKKKTFQVNIPEPCNEDWNKMTPQEQGRFCGKCAKTIIDYSYQSDRAIAKVLKENNGQICGRFRSDQLQRDLVLEPQFYQNTRWKAFGLMISGLLAAGTLKGQEAVTPSNSTEINSQIISNIENKKTPKNKISLSGRILKEGSKEALIGATIILKGSNLGSATDINGAFQLAISTENSHLIKNELILEVSYLGYYSKEVIVKKEELQNNLSINLTDIHLTISSVKMPTVDCIGERFSKNSYVVGNLPVSNNLVSHEILPLPYRDQTLYQWVLKKIRARKAKKAKDE